MSAACTKTISTCRTSTSFLDTPTLAPSGSATSGPTPGDGVRFENVSFKYPGSNEVAVDNLNLHIKPGSKLAIVGENGSGKTTLIKLLTRMYEPTTGRVTLDGLDLRQWSQPALHRRIGVIFQDFVRYQLKVGENIGAGDDRAYDDRGRWDDAAERGLAKPIIETLPSQYDTQLGKWFKDGRELSLGQWQKVALARSFMRQDAEIVRARRAHRVDGRRGRGPDLRALPRAHRRQDRDRDLAPILDGPDGGSDHRARQGPGSSSAARTTSWSRRVAAMRRCSTCRRRVIDRASGTAGSVGCLIHMQASWLVLLVCTTAAADDGWRYKSRADGHRMTNDKIDVPPDPPLVAFAKAGTFYVITVDRLGTSEVRCVDRRSRGEDVHRPQREARARQRWHASAARRRLRRVDRGERDR